MYFLTIDRDKGELVDLQMVPLQARRMRLEPARNNDVAWLRDVLDRVSRPFGSGVEINGHDMLSLRMR